MSETSENGDARLQRETKQDKIERAEELADEIQELIEDCENSSETLTESFVGGLKHAKDELDVTAEHERKKWRSVDVK